MYEVLEEMKIATGIYPQSITSAGTTFTSSYVCHQDYERVIAIGYMATMTATKICTVYLYKATDVAGGSAASAGTAVFTAAAGALNGMAAVEKQTQELGYSYPYAAVHLVTDESIYGCGILLLGQAKIKPVTQTYTTG